MADSTAGTLLLVDGHALVYRGFFALQQERPLTNARGELTTGAFAFTSMLLKALEQLKPRFVAAAFDMSAPTIRLAEFSTYKANRAATPPGLKSQVLLSRRVLDCMGIPMYEIPGYEADDVIGTLATTAARAGLDVVILSGDNDLLQLVNERVRVLASRRGISDTVMYDDHAVREKFGLAPVQIPDYKALRGDSSDNIPGVPGIGEKTAQKLLLQFGTIEALLARVDDLPLKQRELIAPRADTVRLAKRLTTIVCDLPVELNVQRLELGDIRRPAVIEVFRDLGFKSLIDRLPKSVAAASDDQLDLFEDESPASSKTPPAVVISSLEQVDEFIRAVRDHGSLAFNVQATGTQPMRSDLVGVGLAAGDNVGYVPLGHTEATGLDRLAAMDALRRLFADERIPKLAHNAKFHMELLGRFGLPVEGLSFDTMIAAYLLESAQRAFALRDLAWSKLQCEVPSVASLLGTGKKAVTMAELPIAQSAEYACLEAAMVETLAPILERELSEAGQSNLYHRVELPLVSVLADMESVGVQVDEERLRELGQDLQQRLATLEAEIFGHVGHAFNINSTQQLSQVLFDELQLHTRGRRSKTKSGHQSTGVEVLEELRGVHPSVEMILEHRQLQKLKSTYVDALQLLMDPVTHRVHTTFNQAVAATGRLSSSDPNLQNIPIRTEVGRRVRQVFTARPGAVLLSADYSQIELRILAHMANDPTLLEAFARGEDPHAVTAAEVLGLEMGEVTSEHRRVAKMVNYGVLYGMSDFGLAERLGLPPADASSFIQRYFERFGTVREFQDRIVREVASRGYAETLMGRRRYFPEIRSPIHSIRQAAVRAAVNAPIQGSASDIVKVAMIAVDQFLKAEAPTVTMLLQVHDELLMEGASSELESIAPQLKRIMESAMALKAPLHVDFKIGGSWEDMHSLAVPESTVANA